MKRRQETDKLESRLLSLGRSIQSQFTKRGFGTITFGILFGFYALFVIDYLTDIPYVIRISLCVIGAIYAVYYFNKYYLSKARVQLSAEDVSLKVEEKNPGLQSRLISMLQFQSVKRLPAGISENLVEGMVDQAIVQVNDIRMSEIVDNSWFKKHFKRITLTLIVIAGTAYLAPNYTLAYLKRFVDPSAEYPTWTQIVDVSVDKVIPAGDPFVITVNAEGELPEIGSVSIYTEETGTVEFELIKDPNQEGVYTSDIAPINEEAELTVYLGDDTVGPKAVIPTPRPFLKEISVTITSPDYTKLEPKTELNGNVRAIKGSQLKFTMTASKKLSKLNITSKTKDFTVPQLVSSDQITWTMEVTANKSFSYQVDMADENGLASASAANYQVSVMRDRPPVIRITKPSGGSELAPVSLMPLRFKVNDDIGIDSVAVKYSIIPASSTDEFQDIDYDNAQTLFEEHGVDSKTYGFDGLWDNNKISLRTGDTINFWIEARDRSPEGHIQRSSDRQIMIISAQDYRNKLLERLSDNVEKVDEPIIDLKDSARKLKKDDN